MAMKIDTMKWLDRHAGAPICLALTLLQRLTRLFSPAPGPVTTLRRVLYVELSEMGSMVAAYPIMQGFKQRHPETESYFLTFKQNRACLDELNLVPRENVILIENTSLGSFVRSGWAAVRTLRSRHFDAVIDFELFSRISAILCHFARARYSAGFNRMSLEGLYRGNLHTHPVGYNHYAHISQNFLSLIRALENEPAKTALLKERLEAPTLPIEHPPPRPALRTEVWRRLSAACPDLTADSRLIILNPNAGNLLPIRAWPLENYTELARRLLQDPDNIVLVMGTAEASADAATMRRELASPRLIDFTQQTAFSDLLPLFSLGDVLVTNDSGPAHFAALTDIAIQVFFGPETPRLYRPLSLRCENFYSNYHCSPCLNAYNHRTTKCANNLCLQCIGVEEVEAAVRKSLAGYPVPARP